jgi:hypothetical protein
VATTEIRAHVSILKLSSTVRILVVGARHPIESTSAQLQWGPQPYSSTRVAECVLLVGGTKRIEQVSRKTTKTDYGTMTSYN